MSFITDELDGAGPSAADESGLDVAMAIRRCLESLVKDARRNQMADLAEFLSLAVLAAEDAARSRRATTGPLEDLAIRRVVGSC